MFQFAHLNHLFALLLLVILVMLFVGSLLNRKKLIQQIGSAALIQKLNPLESSSRKKIKFSLIILALLLLIIAWANPQLGNKFEKQTNKGIDIVFAIDVSTSMNAQDIVPSRITKAKQIVSDVLKQDKNNRIALIVFAGNAYLQMPLSVDYSSAQMYLNNINTDLVPKQGTHLAEAIALAMKSYDQKSEGFKTLIILSDGEDHDGDAIDLVKQANELGIIVHTIGVGSNNPTSIPIDKEGNLKKDKDGNTVYSKMNETMLQDLANLGKGKYFSAQQSQIDELVVSTLNEQEKRKINEKVFTQHHHLFPYFLVFAATLLILDMLILERKNKALNL